MHAHLNGNQSFPQTDKTGISLQILIRNAAITYFGSKPAAVVEPINSHKNLLARDY